MNTKIDGNKGEQIATEYLQSIGYRIVARNVYLAGGEIDIIAGDGNTLVFVEVKYRATNKFGSPLESITQAKRKTLLNTIRCYISKHGLYGKNMRIDVIGILDGEIEHIKDAMWLN